MQSLKFKIGLRDLVLPRPRKPGTITAVVDKRMRRSSMGQFLTCRNETRDMVIGDKIRKADNYFTRLFGLLPKGRLEPGEGLWIVPCNDIHSIGMRFVFDALFLDKDQVVVHRVERMKPFRISGFVKGAKSVLELDAGIIERTGTQLGDRLVFLPSACCNS